MDKFQMIEEYVSIREYLLKQESNKMNLKEYKIRLEELQNLRDAIKTITDAFE